MPVPPQEVIITTVATTATADSLVESFFTSTDSNT